MVLLASDVELLRHVRLCVEEHCDPHDIRSSIAYYAGLRSDLTFHYQGTPSEQLQRILCLSVPLVEYERHPELTKQLLVQHLASVEIETWRMFEAMYLTGRNRWKLAPSTRKRLRKLAIDITDKIGRASCRERV